MAPLRRGCGRGLAFKPTNFARADAMSDRPTDIRIRQMSLSDIPAVLELERKVFPEMLRWTEEELTQHLSVFPGGQLVAVDTADSIVGSSSSLIIDWDDYAESAKWSSITGHGRFSTHNPRGKTLYGADLCVAPSARRHGVGSLFYDARKSMVRNRGLKHLLTGGRIPGYAQVAHEMTPQEYVPEVVRGRREDATLSFQLANDLIVLDVVPEYLDDPDSRGFATLLEWLNPEYTMTVNLEENEQAAAIEAPGDEEARDHILSPRVRVAAFQYLLRPIRGFEEFATQVEVFVRSAQEYRCQFARFPEYFSMQLLSYLREPAPARAVRRLAQLTAEYETLFKRLARESGLYIIAGTHPVIEKGELFNAAHLFTPNGQVFRQKKVHLTQTEKGPYQMGRGHGFYVYHTDYGRVAILVCYDVEFPEAARVLAEAGAQIIFVPSCTDERQGFCRVRYCAQARASENQIYLAMAGTVGNLPEVPMYGNALRTGRNPNPFGLLLCKRWDRRRRDSESGTDGHC